MFKNNGFTLIELMIVIVIITVLVGVAVPSYTRQIDLAKAQAAKANVSAIRTAAITYYYAYDSYTTDFSALSSEAGTKFDTYDGDWTYFLNLLGTTTRFRSVALKVTGKYSGQRIRVDEKMVWSGNYVGPGRDW